MADDNSGIFQSNFLTLNKVLSQLVTRTGTPVATRARLAAASSTNATIVKNSAGAVYQIIASNINTSTRYLKMYDTVSAPVVGTDTPIMTIVIAANSLWSQTFSTPLQFTSGVAYAMTGGAADTDTTAITANDIHGILIYL